MCRDRSGCQALMLGRGMVADPGLAWAIQADELGQRAPPPISWAQTVTLLQALWALTESHVAPAHRHGRLKQWLHHLRRSQPAAQSAFDALRPLTHPDAVSLWLTELTQEHAPTACCV